MVTGAFLTPLRMEDTGDGEHFKLLEPLDYVSSHGVHYRVDAGFVTDFNSVPWFFRRLIPKSNNANRASVLHDGAYALGYLPLLTDAAYRDRVSRISDCAPLKDFADALYEEAMAACGVHPVKRWLMYQAVKRFGQKAWDAHAEERKQKAEAA